MPVAPESLIATTACTLAVGRSVASGRAEAVVAWENALEPMADDNHPQIVAAHKAESDDQTHLLDGRLEGEFILSYKTSGGWVAITKDILTEVLGAGQDVKIVGLPRVAAGVLKLMCPNFVILL